MLLIKQFWFSELWRFKSIGVSNNISSPLGEVYPPVAAPKATGGEGEGNAEKCTPSPLSSPEGEDEVYSIGKLKMALCYQRFYTF